MPESKLSDWLAQAHHATDYGGIIEIGKAVCYYPELENDIYRAAAGELDRQQQQFVGMIISRLYQDSQVSDIDLEYFGFGSDGLELADRTFRRDSVLTRATGASAGNCRFYGDFVGESSESVSAYDSEFRGENVFIRSKGTTVKDSTFLGDDFGRDSKLITVSGGEIKGEHSLSHAKGVRVINTEIRGALSFCSSSDIAAFSEYINCIYNPKNGIIVAHTIDHAIDAFGMFSPEETRIFAVVYKGDKKEHPNKKHYPVIKIKKSDIEGECTSGNLEDRLRHICAKYGVEIPEFLKEKE